METIDKAKYDLTVLETQRTKVSDALLKSNEMLMTAKAFTRGRIKDAIKNYEQELKKIDRLIKEKSDDILKLEKSSNKWDSKTEAYKQGIDPNAAWANAISSGIGSVSNAITSVVNPLSGGPKKVLEGSEPLPAPPGYLENDPFKNSKVPAKASDWYFVYFLAGLFILYKLFKK